MDPHFDEYLAAIAGMREMYGDRPEDQPTEFHDGRCETVSAAQTTAVVAV